MKLINSTPSAFGRKVAIAMHEKNIPFEMVFDVPWNADTVVPQYSPLQQLPILVTDDGQNIYDSMYIVEWLERKHPKPPLLPPDDDGILAVKRLQLLSERLMEILVLMAFEENREHPSAAWMQRQQRKFAGGIAAVSELVGNRVPPPDAAIHYDDIAAACALTWFDFMLGNGLLAKVPEARWRTRHPNLVAYVNALEARDSFRATSPEMFRTDLQAVVS